MSRMMPVIKREFMEAVSSKAFLIGTILGPVLIIGLFAVQFLILAKGGGGQHRVVIMDASERGIGDKVAQMLEQRAGAAQSFIARATYDIEVEQARAEDRTTARDRLSMRVVADSLDGFLWIPREVITGEGLAYEGSNATNTQAVGELRSAVQAVVQSERLRDRGIDEAMLGDALAPVRMEVAKTGQDGAASSTAAAKMLAFGMGFAIYLVVIMYGQSIMSSVQEEKRDRVVEVIVSSIRATDLLVGKVVGIGVAGVLQMVVWVIAAGVLITHGGEIAGMLGASDALVQTLSQQSMLPDVPLSVGVIFVLYFAGGFFLFATMFAIIGAIVTNAQEAQQFVFPVLLPLMIGFFMAMPSADNPNGAVAVIGSLVPFTSPIVMPVRSSIVGIDWIQLIVSLLLLYGTAALIIWLASKIYRTAIFATGKKPSMAEIIRWMRAA